MTREQRRAVEVVAAAFGWDRMAAEDLGLLLWALFRYYVLRLADKAGSGQ
jgi:hypothetical protein